MFSSSNTTDKKCESTQQSNTTTARMISESEARKPAKEITEFKELPTVKAPTQYQTEYVHQNVQEQPVKIVEQPIQKVEQETVVKQQPVVHKTQEVQVQKNKPIEVVEQRVGHQNLPAVEEKQTVVQPVKSSSNAHLNTTQTTQQTTMGSAGYDNTTYESEHQSGGFKEKAHHMMDSAREKAREVFHHKDKDTTTTRTETYPRTTGTGYTQ